MEKLLKFSFFSLLMKGEKCVTVAMIFFILNLKQFLQILTSKIKYLMLLENCLYKIYRTK